MRVQPAAWLVLMALSGLACGASTEGARSSRWRGFEPCAKDGSCQEGFSCRYDRDRDGGLLSRCVPEPGRCRWHADCSPTQRCVRSGPSAVGVCWERVN
jgi:hypothetical protein